MIAYYCVLAFGIIDIIIALRLITKDDGTDHERKQGFHFLFLGIVIVVGMLLIGKKLL